MPFLRSPGSSKSIEFSALEARTMFCAEHNGLAIDPTVILRNKQSSPILHTLSTLTVPALNSRVTAADGMADCFNFHQTPLNPPAAIPGA